MLQNEIELLPLERVIFALRRLYQRSGYRRYKVSKFEEYDLYAKNKNFLKDSNVLTFTDTDSRLMALKPDVTLSIIKNTKDSDTMQKVFYNESVYRVGSSGFCELMQTGLECIGNIDDYSTGEVISLAYKSLETIDYNFLLDISHMGFVLGLIGQITENEQIKSQLLHAVESKSADTIFSICSELGTNERYTKVLVKTCSLYGKADKTIDAARELVQNPMMEKALNSLEKIAVIMANFGLSDKLCVDFSLINDTHYYNDIIFKGYIDTIAQSVLSGGRYDSLLAKMGKSGGAIGFAVYLDSLDRLFKTQPDSVDVWLKYDSKTDTGLIVKYENKLQNEGKTVRIQPTPGDFKYKEIVDISGGRSDAR